MVQEYIHRAVLFCVQQKYTRIKLCGTNFLQKKNGFYQSNNNKIICEIIDTYNLNKDSYIHLGMVTGIGDGEDNFLLTVGSTVSGGRI